MDVPQTQLAPRKRTFWKMVRTMLLPAQSVVRLMTGCGGGKGRKVKRRLTLRNMQQAKDVFLQSTIQRPPPTEVNNNSRLQDPNSSPPSIPPPPPPNESELFSYDDINIYVPLAPRSSVLQPEVGPGTTNVHANIPPANASTLPAPLNLEEAQILLESLALSCNDTLSRSCNDEEERHEGTLVEQLVNVDIESAPPNHSHDHGRASPTSHISSNSSTPGDDPAELDNDENIIEGNRKMRIEVSSTSRLESISYNNNNHNNDGLSMLRSRTSASLSFSSQGGDDDFHGWRGSSVEVSSSPPVTLAFIPSGLCVGDRIVWVREDHPEIGTVRWIGKIRHQFYAGIEFDKPVGNSSGIYGYGVGMHKRLFTCQLAYGRFVPVKELVLYKDYHDTGVKSGIVCIICRDDFLDTWEPDICLQTISKDEDDLQPPHMVSTKCGHLYHWGCLDHWFSTKKKTDYHCPFCLKPMVRDEVIRIFPSQL